jgi:hypothetical protein
MTVENSKPEQDPSEGSRATVERELKRVPDSNKGSGSIRKPEMPIDGRRAGEKNT